jgi:hypothetical protein
MDQADTTTQAEVFADASKNPVVPLVGRMRGDMSLVMAYESGAMAEREACRQIARRHEEASRELGLDGAADAAASIAETISARGEPL